MAEIVHIANTDVEFEFAHPMELSLELEQNWSRHSLCLQLQFLPLLYAQPQDIVAVTALPQSNYLTALQDTGWWPEGLPHLALLQEKEIFQGKECHSWGPSRQVQAWAKARQMKYAIPQDWQTICHVNSKAFSFRYTCLSEAALIYNERELLDWLQRMPGPKVLKTCFGLSGQGNRLIHHSFPSSDILAFCQKEWQQRRPIICEPWLDRILDFSTQWFIHSHRQIEWIGATRFETDSQGAYQGTLAGPKEMLFASFQPFLEEHRQVAQKALEDIAAIGFFGPVGIDALLYRHSQDQSICLYPLVEINGRQTMSLVALRLQRRLCPHQVLRLAFQPGATTQLSLLPNQLINIKGKTIAFKRHLTATILPAYRESLKAGSDSS